jgi:ligand-binding sensor domain-containing protein/serine phosphatase RsbU (regulator of sigma subunit)
MRDIRLIAFLFLFTNVNSQQYNIKNYSTKSGLANSIVNHAFIDSKGYLWFSTQGGLSRFDGKTFYNYTTKQGLPGNDITFAAEDKEGNIWIATNGFGVCKFDGNSFQIFDESNGLGNNNVRQIYTDTKNNIWFATRGGGISKYAQNKLTTITSKDGLPGDEFFSITEDKTGNLWFGSRGKGLVKYNGSFFYTYTTKDGLSHNSILSLFIDKAGVMWIGTTAGGLCKYVNNTFEKVNVPGFETDVIFQITQDSHGFIWVATEHGLLKFENEKLKIFKENHGLIASYIYSVCPDYEDNIWVTSNSGVSMFKNESFVTYTTKENLSSNKVTTICPINTKDFVIGTSGSGLNCYIDGRIEYLDIPELSQSIIYTIYHHNDDKIWIGSESSNDGIIVLEKKNNKYVLSQKIQSINGFEIKTVGKIVGDKNGVVWIATYGAGLFAYKDGNFTTFNTDNGLTTNELYTAFVDSKNNLWVGTLKGGLQKFDGEKFTTYKKEDGLGDNSVWSIAENSKGNLFIGTSENGLVCFDGKNFKAITADNGLASNLVYSVECDNKNRVWVGTDKGLNVLSLDELFNIKNIKYYGDANGLKGIEVSQNGFLFGENNQLWIATNNGLTKYNPAYDYVNSTPPKIVINDIRMNYQVVDWLKYADSTDKVTKLGINPVFSYKENHLTFSFQALTTDNVKYQFKLEGSGDEWSPLTTNTEAVYTNIPPGKNYRFLVKALNSDGFWSKEEAIFEFSISPPFWQTWWFYTICAIVAIGAIVGFINYRTAQLAKEKKILEDKVTERTAELKTANSSLSVAYTEIKDSINYAKRIQQAILPLEAEIKNSIPQYFILFKPRDVVSGDFYWFNQKNENVYIAACDCTGHGVPGAFMSIIGTSLLNEVVSETNITEPSKIMDTLREKLIAVLKQQSSDQESKDGMDMVLCNLSLPKNKISFAGANNPLYFIRNGELSEYKGNKQPVGVYGDQLKPFTSQTIDVQKDDMIYIFSDGYPDQFGGEKGKKYLYKRFKEFLLTIANKTVAEQK